MIRMSAGFLCADGSDGERPAMKRTGSRVPLLVQLVGAGVKRGRLGLSDLLQLGKHFQHALVEVACALAAQDSVAWKGLGAGVIRSSCALEVVAFDEGSFSVALDLQRPQTRLDGLDLGERALESLVAGLGLLQNSAHDAPAPFGPEVLAELRHVGRLFSHGIDRIDVSLHTRLQRVKATFDRSTFDRVLRLIERPSEHTETIEGRLLMADFNEPRTRCRIHPSVGDAILCSFDPPVMEEVQDNLRSYVRATGESQRDPSSGRIVHFRIMNIDPLEVETAAATIGGTEFWQEKTVDTLAHEQGVVIPQQVEDLIGRGADLWEDDADFDEFLSGIYERRRPGGSATRQE